MCKFPLPATCLFVVSFSAFLSWEKDCGETWILMWHESTDEFLLHVVQLLLRRSSCNNGCVGRMLHHRLVSCNTVHMSISFWAPSPKYILLCAITLWKTAIEMLHYSSFRKEARGVFLTPFHPRCSPHHNIMAPLLFRSLIIHFPTTCLLRWSPSQDLLAHSVFVVCNGGDLRIEPDQLEGQLDWMTRWAECLKRESRCVGGMAHLDY